MLYLSPVTSKGQVLIPAPLRKQLNLGTADRVIFTISDQELRIQKAPATEEMFGCITSKKKLSDAELEAAINTAVEQGITQDI
ncbi:MAG: AbrB/MazE/SpoVT family DNA-binding domain-containing protein [Patescibacteria group bacterium]